MDKTTNLLAGHVVQLDPFTVGNKAFAGCFMLVTEPKPWGAQGFVQALGPDRETPGGHAYYRASWDEMEPVGRAAWVPPPEPEDT